MFGQGACGELDIGQPEEGIEVPQNTFIGEADFEVSQTAFVEFDIDQSAVFFEDMD